MHEYEELYEELYFEDELYNDDCRDRAQDMREAFKGVDDEQI